MSKRKVHPDIGELMIMHYAFGKWITHAENATKELREKHDAMGRLIGKPLKNRKASSVPIGNENHLATPSSPKPTD